MENSNLAAPVVIDLITTVIRLTKEPEDGWESWGPPDDRVQLAKIKILEDEYVLLRGNTGVYMAFTPEEWAAFKDGAGKGEFNSDAGIPALLEEEESVE